MLAGLLCFLLACARETQRDPSVTAAGTPASHRCPQNAHLFIPIAGWLTSCLKHHAKVLTDAWRIKIATMKIKDGVFRSRSSTQESDAQWCSPTWGRCLGGVLLWDYSDGTYQRIIHHKLRSISERPWAHSCTFQLRENTESGKLPPVQLSKMDQKEAKLKLSNKSRH